MALRTWTPQASKERGSPVYTASTWLSYRMRRSPGVLLRRGLLQLQLLLSMLTHATCYRWRLWSSFASYVDMKDTTVGRSVPLRRSVPACNGRPYDNNDSGGITRRRKVPFVGFQWWRAHCAAVSRDSLLWIYSMRSPGTTSQKWFGRAELRERRNSLTYALVWRVMQTGRIRILLIGFDSLLCEERAKCLTTNNWTVW